MQSHVSKDALVCFGVFEADLRSGELRKCGVKVKIQELPFQALKLLLSRPNEVIHRDQLRQALWPDDVYVDFDRGVISAINRLRDALGDSAENPVFIETVGRRGYRWIAPVHSHIPEAVVQDQTPGAEPEARDFTARYEIGLTTHARQLGPQVRLWLAAAILAVLGLAGFSLWRWKRATPIESIVVLPFDNLSAPAFN